MSSSISNLSVEKQQVATAVVAFKRKDDDAVTVAQAAATTMHREQEALIAVVVAACKTLDEAWAHEWAAALNVEKEKTIIHQLE
jgi:hypothetical protein